MYKTDRERLNETLDYIAGLNLAGDMAPVHVTAVHTFVTNFVNTHYGPKQHWYNKNPAMHTFSHGLSLGKQPGETSAQRKSMRAVALIKAAIAGQGGAAPLAPRTFVGPRDLIDVMWKARVKSAQSAGQAPPMQDFLAYFRLNPAAVLGTNRINITGHLGLRGTGPLNVGEPNNNVQEFWFQFDSLTDRYEFRPPGNLMPGAVPVNAVSITAEHWATVPGRGVAPLPALGGGASFAGITGTHMRGADIMLTTQFSGCSFCVKRYGNDTFAVHLSPNLHNSGLPALGAPALAEQLMGLNPHVVGGDFANAPLVAGGAFHVYGRTRGNVATAGGGNGYPDTVRMYLMGFRQGHDWTIYSQHQNGNYTIVTPVPPHISP